MIDCVFIGFGWKGGDPTNELKKLEKIGIYVYPAPSCEGSSEFGYFVSKQTMTAGEIEEADKNEFGS